MTEEDLQRIEQAEEAITRGIEESEDNFNILTKIIHELYSETNKGELIVAAGAFTLVVNFLIGNESSEPYQFIIYLKLSICLLLFTLVWKFNLIRTSAVRAEKERLLTQKKLDILLKIKTANLKFKLNGDPADILKIPGFLKEMDIIDSERDGMNSESRVVYGKLVNEIEYMSFFSGVAFLLLFFLLNIH